MWQIQKSSIIWITLDYNEEIYFIYSFFFGFVEPRILIESVQVKSDTQILDEVSM